MEQKVCEICRAIVKKRGYGRHLRHKHPEYLENKIIELYSKGLKQEEVAKLLGICRETVLNVLKKRGCKTRRRKDYHCFKVEYKEEIYEEDRLKKLLHTLYWEKEWSIIEISEQLQVCPETVHRWFKVFNIPKRSHKEQQKLSVKKRRERHKKAVLSALEKFEKEGFRCIPLSSDLGCPIPDFVALKGGKVYAVEVQMSRNDPKIKYKELKIYDEIIVLKER